MKRVKACFALTYLMAQGLFMLIKLELVWGTDILTLVLIFERAVPTASCSQDESCWDSVLCLHCLLCSGPRLVCFHPSMPLQ